MAESDYSDSAIFRLILVYLEGYLESFAYDITPSSFNIKIVLAEVSLSYPRASSSDMKTIIISWMSLLNFVE